jgi:chloramphenicol-sensitive protein RarD
VNGSEDDRQNGLPHAVGAYLVWGMLPLYLRLVQHVPAFEFVGWRLVFTLPVCLVIVVLRRQVQQVIAALGDPRVLGLLLASSLLIGGNWLLYVSAIQSGHVFATSLGYYINPLMNVLAGTLFLGERLNRRQWSAVAIAGIGVSLLAWDAREMLGIALVLAATFSGYGLVRRFTPVGALPGLTIETILLLIPAIAILVWQAQGHDGISLGRDWRTDLLLPLAGVLTAIPLLMFAIATRRMDYSTLGFVQFIAPTLVFALGLFVFREPLREVQLTCFVLIWSAVALFVWDLLSRRRQLRNANR